MITSSNITKSIRVFFWLFAISFGVLHAVVAANHHSMSEDGINYLEMGAAYFRGDWGMAINPVWNPLYSWILGAAMQIVQPSLYWEFRLVHFVNLFIFLFTFVCFEFFWRQVMSLYRKKSLEDKNMVYLPEWGLLALGYTFFIWSSLTLIKIWVVEPDMCVSAIVYLAGGIILKIRQSLFSIMTFLALGVILGLGYLTKSVMFPLGILFLIVSCFTLKTPEKHLKYVFVSFLAFIVISGSFVVLLHEYTGRWTFGDAGKLTYTRYVGGTPYPHGQNGLEGIEGLKHPSRKIFDNPPVYEFSTPVPGTYPISYDPSYWYEGITYRFNLHAQILTLLRSAQTYYDLFFLKQGGIVAGMILLLALGRFGPPNLRFIFREFGLTLIALGAFGLYALVYVESRYIAPFVVLFWTDFLLQVRLSASEMAKRLVPSINVIMILFLILNFGFFHLPQIHTRRNKSDFSSIYKPPSWPGQVTESLIHMGIQPGDHVAVIGYAFGSFWAYLARVKIIAEMLEKDAKHFWIADPQLQSQVLEAFLNAGATVVVAENVPYYAELDGWHQIDNTNYYVHFLDKPERS